MVAISEGFWPNGRMTQAGWRLFQAAIIVFFCYIGHVDAVQAGKPADAAGLFFVGVVVAWLATMLLTWLGEKLGPLFVRLNERYCQVPSDWAVRWRLGKPGQDLDRRRIGED